MPNIEIVEILKVGLPGLIFLLCAMSFRLLSKEQEKNNPSELMLKKITQFGFFTLAFTLLTLGAGLFDLYLKDKEYDKLDSRELILDDRETRLNEWEEKVKLFEQKILLSEIEPRSIELTQAPDSYDLRDTEAAICLGKADTSKYIGRQILLLHDDSNMAQVKASFDGRCVTGKDKIMVPEDTLRKLGIENQVFESNSKDEKILEVFYQVAIDGQKFILPGEE